MHDFTTSRYLSSAAHSFSRKEHAVMFFVAQSIQSKFVADKNTFTVLCNDCQCHHIRLAPLLYQFLNIVTKNDVIWLTTSSALAHNIATRSH